MRSHSLAVCLLLVLFSPLRLLAQSNATDGALDGFVRDPSAASVPAATLVATNLRTGLVTTATTNAEGYYRFPLLQVGEYEVLVSAPAFAEYRQTGIRLSAGQQARVDMALTIGGSTETVQVTADASMVLSSQAGGGRGAPGGGDPRPADYLPQRLQLPPDRSRREGTSQHRFRHDAVRRRRRRPHAMVHGRHRQHVA